MRTPPDEARLTAYALGELDDDARAAVDAHLASNPTARRAVDEIRQVAGVLTDELAAEAVPQLTGEQRALIEAAASAPGRSKRRRRRPRALWTLWLVRSGVAAAILIVIGVGVISTLRSVLQPSADVGVSKTFDYMAWNQASRTGTGAGPSFAGTPRPEGMQDDMGRATTSQPDPDEGWNREGYDRIVENPFRKVIDHPLSTFSIDVDTASYSIVRRWLTKNRRWPPPGAVRIEELINYFDYEYAGPAEGGEHPFAAHVHMARCPWQSDHRLIRVAIKGREIADASRPSSNFVFLLDVSGSMGRPDKLPLVKAAMRMLVDVLGENDRVAIAVYAGASGLVLDSTTCDRKREVLAALDSLHAGGSTNGGEGIVLAYRKAEEQFLSGGVNRVILCTDGDFNVGTTSRSELVRLIETKAKGGVFLTILGFGRGNLQDATMEELSGRGNGNYAYIDTMAEARKVLLEQMNATLVTIAKDVKIQVEFNPARVEAYRLIGYENRILAAEDFNDDTKDAGEIGAGHTVTALYEVVPAGRSAGTPKASPLRYQNRRELSDAAHGSEVLTVKLRYKKPDGDESVLMTHRLLEGGAAFAAAPADFRFAAAVASFGMILRDSKHKGTYTLDAVMEQADSARGPDRHGYRAEFVELVRTAKLLASQR